MFPRKVICNLLRCTVCLFAFISKYIAENYHTLYDLAIKNIFFVGIYL